AWVRRSLCNGRASTNFHWRIKNLEVAAHRVRNVRVAWRRLSCGLAATRGVNERPDGRSATTRCSSRTTIRRNLLTQLGNGLLQRDLARRSRRDRATSPKRGQIPFSRIWIAAKK